jgi:acyl-coenzyme A thioesterase PaaI-like protein
MSLFNFIGMDIKTHKKASNILLGTPTLIDDGVKAIVELAASNEMVVDDRGLVHGGFTFGLADYAAMLAVNDPFVVLGSSSLRFLAPVRLGDLMRAVANVKKIDGKKRIVEVDVRVGETKVLSGEIVCYVLQHHVLD